MASIAPPTPFDPATLAKGPFEDILCPTSGVTSRRFPGGNVRQTKVVRFDKDRYVLGVGMTRADPELLVPPSPAP